MMGRDHASHMADRLPESKPLATAAALRRDLASGAAVDRQANVALVARAGVDYSP